MEERRRKVRRPIDCHPPTESHTVGMEADDIEADTSKKESGREG